MSALFNELLYRPFLNALVFLYENVTFGDLGLAIIALTIIIRIILFPLFHKSAHYQKITQSLQPKLKKIQKDHKDNREAQTKAMLALYSEHKINPFTPILLLIAQIPILIALFLVIKGGFSEEALSSLYSFVPRPEVINDKFLGVVDLTQMNIFVVLLAVAAQYMHGKLTLSKRKSGEEPSKAEELGRKMVFMGPAITFIVLLNFPSALGLYWLTSTSFSLIQQVIVNRQINKKVENHQIQNSRERRLS
ncbi:MAG: membrane protein insertase YidC [Candidatus Colwellbacteria bacterium]|nr:membrane protein insertase YidC [Candidatus Colwellbacteria bacterium]